MKATALAPWRERNPLRQWRRANGHTVADAAVMLNTGVTTLTKWENGAATPSVDRMERIAAVTERSGIEQEWNTWQTEQRSA